MKRILPILILAAVMSGGCRTGSYDEINTVISRAETAVDAGDIGLAGSLVESIAGDSEIAAKLSAYQRARLSIVYMQMADVNEQEINTANATEMYRSAYRQAADSADAYYGSLPFEKMQYVGMLHTLTNSIDAPIREIHDDHYHPDSLFGSTDSVL